MLYPFFGVLGFMLSLAFLSMSGLIILIHKTDGIKYTARRGSWLAVYIIVGIISLFITAYCVIATLHH